MRKLAVFVAAMSICSLSFGAKLNSMNKKEVTNALSDKTVTTIPVIMIDDKLVATSIAAYFSPQGQINGRLAKQPKDQANQPLNDQGTWQVKRNGMLCVTWQHWNGAKPCCTFVYDLKNSILFDKPKEGLEALVFKAYIQPGNQVKPR